MIISKQTEAVFSYLVFISYFLLFRYRFTYINIGSPGRNNDSYIFEKSQLKQQHVNHPLFSSKRRIISNTSVPICLIGDSAFRLSSFLMKPYPGNNISDEERHFNYVLSRSRRVVENAFGHYKARFRRIGKGLEVDITNAPIIIKACCILHNILIEKKDDIPQQWVNEATLSNNSRSHLQPEFSTVVGDNNLSAVGIRNAIATYLFESENLGNSLLTFIHPNNFNKNFLFSVQVLSESN